MDDEVKAKQCDTCFLFSICSHSGNKGRKTFFLNMQFLTCYIIPSAMKDLTSFVRGLSICLEEGDEPHLKLSISNCV